MLKQLVWVLFGLALVTAVVQFPRRLLPFARPILPVVGMWSEADAQYRRQLEHVPYDFLRAAEAELAPDVSVLLLTPGQDVRRSGYITFHRALYFLAPRPVWWQSPAPPDSTWESRWWVSAALTPTAIQAVATAKGVDCVLAYDIAPPVVVGRLAAEWDDGYLLQLDDDVSCLAGEPVRPRSIGTLWPLQLLGALVVIGLVGDLLLSLVVRFGYRLPGVERVVLAWSFGAGGLSLAMLWLNAVGIGLQGQLLALSLLAGLWLLWRGWESLTQRHCGNEVSDERKAFLSWRSFGFAQCLHRADRGDKSLRLGVLNFLLWLFLALHAAYVGVIAMGRPLQAWDSWVNWSSKARVIFFSGGITPAVYAEPARAVTLLDYPLFLPLLEAWVYGWLAAPDDRLVGVISFLFYLTLIAVCYIAVYQQGGSRLLAVGAAAVVGTMTNVVLPATAVFAEIPLMLLATIAAVYLVKWLEGEAAGSLLIAALAAGLMPWVKREGLFLLGALCLAALLIGRMGVRRLPTRRTWIGVGACVFSAALLAGPWWVFVGRYGIANNAFLPINVSTFLAHLDRLPIIAGYQLRNLLSAEWNFIWPMALLFALLVWRFNPARVGSTGSGVGANRFWRAIYLLPLMALIYLVMISFVYVFSDFVPYQQHVISSIHRLSVQVVALVVVWMAYVAVDSCENRPPTTDH